MQEFLSTPWVITVGWVLGALGWLVGISAGILQFKSYAEQKQLEQGYRAILEQAKRDWQGEYTEEQVKILSQELRKLERKIHSDIPREARRIFLMSQLHDLKNNIGQSYQDYQNLIQELDVLSSTDQTLEPELQDAIEHSIMPEYVKSKRETKKLQLSLVIVLLLLVFFNLDTLAKTLFSFLGDNYYRNDSNWLILYGGFVFIIAWFLHSTIFDKFIEVKVKKLKQLFSRIDSKNETIIDRILFPFLSILLMLSLTLLTLVGMFIVILAFLIFSEVILFEYSSPYLMFLSLIALTGLFAIPTAILALSLYHLFIKSMLAPLRRSWHVLKQSFRKYIR